MSEKAKKILITTKKHEIFIVRHGQHTAIHGFCPECKAEVEMLTFDSAINFSGIGGYELIRRCESGEVHSIETTGGHLLICKSSIENSAVTDAGSV